MKRLGLCAVVAIGMLAGAADLPQGVSFAEDGAFRMGQTQVGVRIVPSEGWRAQYRNGAFKIAQKANVPIVVCSLVNSRAILHNMFRKHTEVWLDVLDVIPAEELVGKTTIEVGERVHAVMEAGVVRREQAQGLR